MNAAKTQAQSIIDAANRRRNEILAEVQNEAETLKAKIVEQGYAQIEAERKRVQEELRAKVASLAVAGAEKLLPAMSMKPLITTLSINSWLSYKEGKLCQNLLQ